MTFLAILWGVVILWTQRVRWREHGPSEEGDEYTSPTWENIKLGSMMAAFFYSGIWDYAAFCCLVSWFMWGSDDVEKFFKWGLKKLNPQFYGDWW